MTYEIVGTPLPVVTCTLQAGERMITESGAMCWMSPNMLMETSTNGGIGKAFGRMFSGESMFQNIYTAQGGQGVIAFASSFPGSIIPFHITPGNKEIDGSVVEYDLQPGQQIIVDTGYLAAMSETCQITIQRIKGVKNVLFGGEGLFNTVVTGPGKVYLQSMPVSSLAQSIIPYIPSKG